MKCTEIRYVKNTFIPGKFKLNKFRYNSFNNLGLIYIIEFDDVEKACEFMKESAFAEFPFGQSNYGLLRLLYFNDFNNAECMFEKALKNNFALAAFNLGFLREKNGRSEEAIQYYIDASDNENSPLMFHGHKYYDERLEISKKFILCCANLKLAEFYFSNSNYDESQKYFVRAIMNLNIKCENFSYQFLFKFNKEETKNAFSYLKSFIWGFPLFNLEDHFSVSMAVENSLNERTERASQIIQNHSIHMKCCDIEEEEEEEYHNDETEQSQNDDNFKDPKDLFNFVVSNSEYKDKFIDEIKSIVEDMIKILFSPPYAILFGRMKLRNEKRKSERNDNHIIENINHLFYEGLSL